MTQIKIWFLRLFKTSDLKHLPVFSLSPQLIKVTLYLMTKYSVSPDISSAQLINRHLKALACQPAEELDDEIHVVISHISPLWNKLGNQQALEVNEALLKNKELLIYEYPFSTLPARLLCLMSQYCEAPTRRLADAIVQLLTPPEKNFPITVAEASIFSSFLAADWSVIAKRTGFKPSSL